ncbi:MAG: phosphodiester glycosidase family protein, partial [Micromonosporaceae bacterium]
MDIRRGVLAVPLTCALVIGLSGPVVAATPVATPAPAAPVPVTAPASSTPMETESRSRPVAPGVRLDSFERRAPHGWVRGDVLTTDLTGGSTVDYLSPGEISKAEPVSTQAKRQRAVAAVNGDFFDINNSNAPLGPAIDDKKLVKSPSRTWDEFNTVAGIDAHGAGRILELEFEGSITPPSGDPVPLTRLNSPDIPAGGVGAYNKLWGSYSRARIVDDADRVTEVTVVDGVVTAV